MKSDEMRAEFDALRKLLEQRPPAPPRLALTRTEAAESLGVSVDSLERYVLPHVRVIRRGSLRLIPVAELERFCDEQAEFTLPKNVGRPNGRPTRTTSRSSPTPGPHARRKE